MGTARAPVVGSGSCPACTERVASCCFFASAICILLEILAASERPAVLGRLQAWENWSGDSQPFGQSPELPASMRRQRQRGLLARRKAMFHSIRPTRIGWQVAPVLGLLLAGAQEVPDPTIRLADQPRGWHYGYLRKSVI